MIINFKAAILLLMIWLTCAVVVAQQKTHSARDQQHDYEAEIDPLAVTCEQLRASLQNKPQTSRSLPIFIFHTDEFWLNLHHFLYVLGRAENKTRDSARDAVSGAPADQKQGLTKLTSREQTIWREAVSAYAQGISQKDLVFDSPLPALTKALALAADAEKLTGVEVEPASVAVLERAAPVYRKAWWRNHQAANRVWQTSIQQLVDRHGAAVLAFLTSKYQMKWPAAGYSVHVSAYTNWAGAYSTYGNVLVLSSLHEGLRGLYGFETVFHEGMHQWDSQMFEALREQARLINKLTPRDLSHALIFFTAGDAVRRVVPEHVPYADKFGVWQRGLMQYKAPVEAAWKPYLDGRGTRDEALADLIKRTATEPKLQ